MPKLPPHFAVKKAHQAQLLLSKLVVRENRLSKKVKTVAGVDVHYVGDLSVGAVVVVDYDSLEVLETSVAPCPVQMPYVPTLLSFRELPPAMAAITQLSLKPDAFLVDAQGWAHPYRCGFASHLGLVLQKPTVGAAKRRLTGEPHEVAGRTLWSGKVNISKSSN